MIAILKSLYFASLIREMFLIGETVWPCCFVFFQFERDGYLVFENFYSPVEIAEMLKAGKNLYSQAPKEERKIFSSKDPESSQVNFCYSLYKRELNCYNFLEPW